jgi:hypothetical protein
MVAGFRRKAASWKENITAWKPSKAGSWRGLFGEHDIWPDSGVFGQITREAEKFFVKGKFFSAPEQGKKGSGTLTDIPKSTREKPEIYVTDSRLLLAVNCVCRLFFV